MHTQSSQERKTTIVVLFFLLLLLAKFSFFRRRYKDDDAFYTLCVSLPLKVRSVFLKNGSTDFCRQVGQMHLISARAERAYSRSILKRLKMSQTRSSANTFQIHTKNISSDNTHLRFSSHRAHKIEEEIQVYSQPARSLSRAHRRGTGAFCSRRERQDAQFCGDFPLVLLKHIAETTHISASHHAERIKLKKKRVDIYYHHPSRVHFCECTEEEQIGFLLATRATKIFKNASDF